jgi:hypothetical protein
LKEPLQIRRSQDFYVSALVELNCINSSNVQTGWLILNCTLNCSVPANLNPLIELSPNEVFIAARGLTYGRYEIKFTATIRDSPHLTSSLSAFVKINPTGITANLVQNGTSAVTSGQNQELVLDPGYYSINPDEESFNASVSHPIRERDTQLLCATVGLDLQISMSTL